MANLKKLIVIGDRVLIKPDDTKDRTSLGLYLPANVVEKEKVHAGYIIKTGPGYPLPDFDAVDNEPWAMPKREGKYLPLQAVEGDYAIFLRKAAVEIEFEGKTYLIVPQSAILVLVRENSKEED
jgi:chaperonin GroES